MSPAASTRWCPTPEQVMILEEMYRGGVRTPNAAQIQQITDHLSLYGKIEGKNVFYWFQNHKARDRQKLRKRLLGKQLHHQHHHVQQQHFDHHQMMMFQFPTILDHHTPFPQPHDFGLRHRHRHQPLLHHFDQLPCCPISSTPLGFHQFPPYVSSPCFASQPRAEDTFPRMGNTYPWKGEATIYGKPGVENEKSRRIITNDGNDWMMRGDHHYAYDYDNEDHDGDDDDDDCGDDKASGRRHLKTLELFPIKDNTSLKEDNEFSGQPNTISFIKV